LKKWIGLGIILVLLLAFTPAASADGLDEIGGPCPIHINAPVPIPDDCLTSDEIRQRLPDMHKTKDKSDRESQPENASVSVQTITQMITQITIELNEFLLRLSRL